MSSHEDSQANATEQAALGRLEQVVDRAVTQVRSLHDRAAAAESRTAELEALLEKFGSGKANPGDYEERLRVLEEQNGDLTSRLEEGREGVERLLARIRFLEEQR